MLNCLLTGVGGQGTVLASKLISKTAMNKGLDVKAAETIGMAQRGGSVISHVRIGQNVYSPLIAKHSADIIIAFEPAEAVRTFDYLKKGGTIVVCDKAIEPTTVSLTGNSYDVTAMLDFLKSNVDNLIVINYTNFINICENPKVLNVALLGAAARCNALGMTLEEISDTIKKTVPQHYIDINLKALMHDMKED